MAIFEDEKSFNHFINSFAMSVDEGVASDVPRSHLFVLVSFHYQYHSKENTKQTDWTRTTKSKKKMKEMKKKKKKKKKNKKKNKKKKKKKSFVLSLTQG